MSDSRPTWQLVLEVAVQLRDSGHTTFRLADLVAAVQQIDPTRKRESIQPVVQGITVNAGNGPQQPCGKVFIRVEHGWYRLLSDRELDHVVDPAHPAVLEPPRRPQVKGGAAPPPSPSPSRQKVIENRVVQLLSGFSGYVAAYDDLVPFTGEQLNAHRETIRLRRQAGSVRAAISSPAFIASLRRTLMAWDIGVRGSKLVSPSAFTEALALALPALESLESLHIDSPNLPTNLADQLWEVIASLGVVDNQAKLVAGTKTLHHLLPELVVPMDRAWTGKFFRLHLPEWQDPGNQRRILNVAYDAFTRVARQVQPEQYVTGEGWRTSRTKILDNALIGFCKSELSDDQGDPVASLPEITVDVPGYPPTKNEAKSLLSAGHGQADRVRLLLEAAQRACLDQAFMPIDEWTVALDMVVRAPVCPPGDATNYLGGVADVFQDKAHALAALDHLGDLAAVRLYRNDRQIRRVSYAEEEAIEPGYSVTIRVLGDQKSAPSDRPDKTGEAELEGPDQQPVLADEPPRPNPTEAPLPPPAWYPDPSGQARLRWWDGVQWTGHISP